MPPYGSRRVETAGCPQRGVIAVNSPHRNGGGDGMRMFFLDFEQGTDWSSPGRGAKQARQGEKTRASKPEGRLDDSSDARRTDPRQASASATEPIPPSQTLSAP